jgi:hypothetical protein
MGLSFTIVVSSRQRSHSRVRVLWDSWPYYTVSESRPPQPGGPGPRIYIPQEQGGPVIPPATGFRFRRLLRLAGLRWRYSNLPPHGDSPSHSLTLIRLVASLYNLSTGLIEKTHCLQLYFCNRNRCCGKVFTAPLLSNGRITSFNSSGFKLPCRNMKRLIIQKTF